MTFIIKCVLVYGSYMIQQEFCKDCHQKHDCQEVYRQLGHSVCPSITCKVIVAFLFPLVVFIISLVVFDKIFFPASWNILRPSLDGNPADPQGLQTTSSFLMALLTTSVCVFFSRLISKRLGKDL